MKDFFIDLSTNFVEEQPFSSICKYNNYLNDFILTHQIVIVMLLFLLSGSVLLFFYFKGNISIQYPSGSFIK